MIPLDYSLVNLYQSDIGFKYNVQKFYIHLLIFKIDVEHTDIYLL